MREYKHRKDHIIDIGVWIFTLEFILIYCVKCKLKGNAGEAMVDINNSKICQGVNAEEFYLRLY